MMWEPERLDPTIMEGLKIEEQFNAGTLEVPGAYLNIALGSYLAPFQPSLKNILALPHKELVKGATVVPMLTPGPRDAMIIVAEQTMLVRELLKKVGDWDLPCVLFVLSGQLHFESVFQMKGFRFLHRQQFGPSNVAVVPPEDKRELVIDAGSLLFLATPGRAEAKSLSVAKLDVENLIGHFTLRNQLAERNGIQVLKKKDTLGNVIHLCRHTRPEPIVAPGGAITFALHEDGEPNEIAHTPDILVIPPNLEQLTPPTPWSMEVCLQ